MNGSHARRHRPGRCPTHPTSKRAVFRTPKAFRTIAQGFAAAAATLGSETDSSATLKGLRSTRLADTVPPEASSTGGLQRDAYRSV